MGTGQRWETMAFMLKIKKWKLFLFSDDMILVKENPKTCIHIIATNSWSKMTICNTDVQNSIVFQYIESQKSQTETKKLIPFITALRWNKMV